MLVGFYMDSWNLCVVIQLKPKLFVNELCLKWSLCSSLMEVACYTV